MAHCCVLLQPVHDLLSPHKSLTQMGAYSSKPEIETMTEEGSNAFLSFGASAMRGWRLTQEDAHVALLDFDDGAVKSHFFAVFDGHGGAEVAQFAAQTLPAWVKKLPAFRDGDVGSALTEAFLSFDQHLTEKSVIDQLKALAGDDNADDDEDEQINEAIALQEEADMPIEQLMEKYSQKAVPAAPRTKSDVSGGGSSEPVAGGSGLSSPSKAVRSDGDACSASSELVKAESSPTAAPDLTSNGDPGSSLLPRNGEVPHITNGGKEKIAPDSDPKTETTEKSDEQNASQKKEDLSNGEQEAPKKVDKGKQRKVIIPKPKRKVQPAATYQQFLEDCDDEDESSEDEPFGPANALDSDSDEEQLPVDQSDDDEDDDEEDETESSEDEDDDDEADGLAGMFGAPTGDFEEPGKDSGCTAVVAIIRDHTLFVANAGDSRCVVSCNGKAIEMSEDHKPEDERELTRIEKAGGKVTMDGRVNGGLNLSRALGDHTYKANADLPLKEQMISPEPDVRQLTITPEHEFMILACDGIWNSMTSQEVVDFVRDRVDQMKPAKICEELFEHCLAPDTSGDGTGCDNMTAIIVRFDETGQAQKRKTETTEEPVPKKVKENECQT